MVVEGVLHLLIYQSHGLVFFFFCSPSHLLSSPFFPLPPSHSSDQPLGHIAGSFPPSPPPTVRLFEKFALNPRETGLYTVGPQVRTLGSQSDKFLGSKVL